MLYRFLRPALFSLPPEFTHGLTLSALQLAHRAGALHFVRLPPANAPIKLLGLTFPNRIGLAAGLDKNGKYVDALGHLGFGFIEIGTVTPQPQAGQPKPRLFRLPPDSALINRMGFPNDGAIQVAKRLSTRRFAGVCGVNIGKNASTPLSEADRDYVACMDAVYLQADYIAINVSSPNTSELRSLQRGELLQRLIGALVDRRKTLMANSGRFVPLLAKFTVDLPERELIDSVRTAIDAGIDGVIVTNTSIQREGLRSANANALGGLSGRPLFPRAVAAITRVRSEVGALTPIIGVGGVASVADAIALRAAGADLVQIYTGLIYQGPGLIAKLCDCANA